MNLDVATWPQAVGVFLCRDTNFDVATKVVVWCRYLNLWVAARSGWCRDKVGQSGYQVRATSTALRQGTMARGSAQRTCLVLTHCAHEPLAAVHYAVHCLGQCVEHCSWTLFPSHRSLKKKICMTYYMECLSCITYECLDVVHEIFFSVHE